MTTDEGAAGAAARRRTILGIITYLALTLALSAVVWRILIAGGTLRTGGGQWTFALMWCPGVSGLVTRLLFQRTLRGVGWGGTAAKYMWAGYWIPIAYASVVYLPLWIAGYADFNIPLLTSTLTSLHVPVAQSPALVVLTYLLLDGTLGMLPNSLAALGEELGWRGFLVPELAKVTSFTKVGLISGVVWASWHFPLIIGADYHGAGPVWFSMLCFTVAVIGMSMVIAWLRLKSGSVWPAMLLHASHNLFVQSFFDPLTRHAPLTDYTIGEFGAGLAVVITVVAVIVARSAKKLESRE